LSVFGSGDVSLMAGGAIVHALSSLSTPQLLMECGAIGGDVLWLIAYILIFCKGFRDRTYGVPAVALALNFTWEILYTIQFPPSDWPHIVLRWLWLLADCIIVYQYFRFGRQESEFQALRPYFYPLAIFLFISAYVFQFTYRYHFDQPDGYENAFLINFVMSLLFVRFFFLRPDMRGLSYGAAWCKMIGTAILAVIYAMQRQQSLLDYSFMFCLYVSTFLYDVTYTVLLAKRRTTIRNAGSANS
jgi:hypothetical protein